MIIVDTSAIMAIVINEPTAAKLTDRLAAETGTILISAGTVAETFIVAAGKGLSDATIEFIQNLNMVTVPVSETSAYKLGAAYRRWGKGFHSAGLNFGDCFAYALAMERNCPLLYIGNDFAATDVLSALETKA